MKWNGYYGVYAENTLKSAYKENEGNVAEINLLLINLLRAVGVQSHPVLLSTPSHGKINKFYPKQSSFNCVVALAKLNGKDILLDASHDFLKPGNLPFNYINGQGLVAVQGKPQWVNLKSTEIFQESISVNLSFGEEGLKAIILKQTGSLSARALRHKIAKDGKDKYVERYIEKQSDWEIDSYSIENEDDVNKSVVEKIEISEFSNIDTDGDIIYLPAMITQEDEENPFTSELRKYPIDFTVPVSTRYILNFKLPEGYAVDEMPQSAKVVLPDKAASFLYKIQNKNGVLQIYCQTKINRTLFLPEEYKTLREFYTHVTEKLNEQIVLKKI